jgi:GTPase
LDRKKTGFVSLIGRPSSGKSTLINTICGYKISIVSKHPQTTRFLVKGIYNDDDSQIIFLDTPGYHHFNSKLNKTLSNLAVKTLKDGDLVIYLVDTTREFGEEEKRIMENVKYFEKKLILVFNKIDDENSNFSGMKKEIEKYLEPLGEMQISALQNTNISELIELLKKNLDFGEMYFPEEYVTDQDIPFRITEIIREKVFNSTTDEIPHSTYVEIESLKVGEEKIIANAIIFVEKETQKGIVIGKGGAKIKQIGIQARNELKEIFEREIDIFLRVKVNHNWRKKDEFIRKIYGTEY